MAVIPPAPPPPVVIPPASGSELNGQRRNVEVQSERPTEEAFQSRNERDQDVVVIENPERKPPTPSDNESEQVSNAVSEGQRERVDIRV